LLVKLFAAFAGMSLLMFGGGYVSIPVLQHAVVDTYGWVTGREFADAMAMTQLTPGPVLIGAAFIGLKAGGLAGAVAATAGVFTPTAVLMVGCAHRLQRWSAAAAVRSALRGVRAAGAGMVVAAAVTIGRMAAPTWLSVSLFLLASLLLLRWRVEAFWVVLVCGATGYFLS
jgi:chromate transporter